MNDDRWWCEHCRKEIVSQEVVDSLDHAYKKHQCHGAYVRVIGVPGEFVAAIKAEALEAIDNAYQDALDNFFEDLGADDRVTVHGLMELLRGEIQFIRARDERKEEP